VAGSDDDAIAGPAVFFLIMDQIFLARKPVLFVLVHPEFPIDSDLWLVFGIGKLTVTVLDIFPCRSTRPRSSLGADSFVRAGVFARYIMFQKELLVAISLVASVDIFFI
jgi:hypothetical protein